MEIRRRFPAEVSAGTFALDANPMNIAPNKEQQ